MEQGREEEQGSSAALCHCARSRAATAAAPATASAAPDRPAASQPPPVVDSTEGEREGEIERKEGAAPKAEDGGGTGRTPGWGRGGRRGGSGRGAGYGQAPFGSAQQKGEREKEEGER